MDYHRLINLLERRKFARVLVALRENGPEPIAREHLSVYISSHSSDQVVYTRLDEAVEEGLAERVDGNGYRLTAKGETVTGFLAEASAAFGEGSPLP